MLSLPTAFYRELPTAVMSFFHIHEFGDEVAHTHTQQFLPVARHGVECIPDTVGNPRPEKAYPAAGGRRGSS